MRTASTPTVSVVIKAYNHAPYVRQTIESVLSQSFQDFEIVVTDDGSTDDTIAILRAFDDPRLLVEALPRNRGISAAMNATIARARGRYLAILNSDDWALPGRLRAQVEFLDTNPDVSLVFGMPCAVDEDGAPTTAYNDFRLPLSFPDFSARTWLRQFFFYGNCLCAPTAMIRHEVYRTLGPYDERLTNLQDMDMWVRALVAGYGVHVMPDELTAFRIRDNDANMSFPRPDTRLRSPFELTKILSRFTDLSPDRFEDAFGAEAAETLGRSVPVGRRVAELALGHSGVSHHNFALEYFYRTAVSIEDFTRLRVLSGTLDALGVRAVETRDQAVRDLKARLTFGDATIAAQARQTVSLMADVSDLEARIAVMSEQLSRRDQELSRRDHELSRREQEHAGITAELGAARASVAAMHRSTSWRVSQPLRAVGRIVRPWRALSRAPAHE